MTGFMDRLKSAQSTTKQDESATESTLKVVEFMGDHTILHMNQWETR